MAEKIVNFVDIYEIDTLKMHNLLKVFQAVDKRLGYRIRQTLVAFVKSGDALSGVFRVIKDRIN